MTVELKFNLQGLYTNTSSAIITAELSYYSSWLVVFHASSSKGSSVLLFAALEFKMQPGHMYVAFTVTCLIE